MKENGFFITSVCVIVAVIAGIIILKNQGKKVAKEESIQKQENNIYIESKTESTNNLVENNGNITNKQDEELFSKYYAQADEILKQMTLEEKVGQMFLVRYPSSDVNEQIINDNPGGYVLFSKDFQNQSRESMLKKINTNQCNSKIKMFMAVDEEGGIVARVSGHSAFRNERFESPQALYSQGGIEKILEESKEKCKLLKSIGLNVNLAPVVDVSTNSSSFIYKRTLGKSAEETAEYAEKLINEMNNNGMISAMKHFPGYGDNADTHTGVAVDNRSYEVFIEEDFKPFIAGIKAGGPIILVNHNIVNCMDKNMPASLSKSVHDILREELKYTGLIITDDLAMNAVERYVKNNEAAVQAVLAGNDMIISSDFTKQKAEVIDAVRNNEISENQIDTAVRRIIACKYYYSII